MHIFNVIFPVLFVIIIGFIIGKLWELDTKSLARVSLYVFTPSLVFSSLAETNLTNQDIIDIMLFGLLWISALSVLLYFFFWLIKSKGLLRSAIMLTGIFPNAGNYGLPVVLFSLGQAGFDRALIFQVLIALFLNSYGVYIASNGRENISKSLLAVFRMPALYAFGAGFIIQFNGLVLAEGLFRSVKILGQAAIPTDMLLLGLQLSKLRIEGNFGLIGLASTFRLVLSPLIALVILWILFDPQSLTAKVLLIQTAAPAAVIANVLAIQFDSRPDLVAGVTFVTTVISLITLPLVLSIIL